MVWGERGMTDNMVTEGLSLPGQLSTEQLVGGTAIPLPEAQLSTDSHWRQTQGYRNLVLVALTGAVGERCDKTKDRAPKFSYKSYDPQS